MEVESIIYEGDSRVLICEGEIDELTAIQAGETGVRLPGWPHFKDAWIMDFRGQVIPFSQVFLIIPGLI